MRYVIRDVVYHKNKARNSELTVATWFYGKDLVSVRVEGVSDKPDRAVLRNAYRSKSAATRVLNEFKSKCKNVNNDLDVAIYGWDILEIPDYAEYSRDKRN